MTDDDRREAERLAGVTFDLQSSHGERYGFIKGYGAACEAKRAEVDRANAAQQDDETHRWSLFEKLDAERARAAKLIHGVTAAGLHSTVDSMWNSIDKAIAEYEAERD